MNPEVRYFTEEQLAVMRGRLGWRTVKQIKKMCPELRIQATWYNTARKDELKLAVLLQIDKHGVTEEFFNAHLFTTAAGYWDDMDVHPGHTTQLFVRAERAEYGQHSSTIVTWGGYYPIDRDKHPKHHIHSETLMDQRHHPHRVWEDGIEDPDNRIEAYVPVAKREPEPEPMGFPKTKKEPTMATVAPTGATGGLEQIMSTLITDSIKTKLEDVLDKRGLTEEAMRDVVREVILDKTLPKTTPISNPVLGGPTLALVHKNFEAAEFWLSYGYSIYMNGPSGSGKTVAAVQLAEKFEGELTIISCHGEMTVYDLVGFNDGHGNYKQTEFFKAWRDGNIILMDEVDKAPGEVNVLLNAALAQGTITFPVGTLNKVHTTKLLFTGNTKMSGADAIYSAGQRQDGSFSNRMVSVDWPFDLALEQTLAENECERHGGSKMMGKDCHMKIVKIREKIDSLGMNYVVGQRQSMMVAAGQGAGREPEKVFQEVVYGWMDENDASRVREAVG